MSKYFRTLCIFSFILLSIKSYAIELTNDFMYGTWETKIQLNSDQCLKLMGEESGDFELYCEINDRTSFHRNNKATSEGKIKISINQNGNVVLNEIGRYTEASEWTLYPVEGELITTLIESDLWFESTPNEKISGTKGVTDSDKITIVDSNTIKTKSIHYGIESTSKRIIN